MQHTTESSPVLSPANLVEQLYASCKAAGERCQHRLQRWTTNQPELVNMAARLVLAIVEGGAPAAFTIREASAWQTPRGKADGLAWTITSALGATLFVHVAPNSNPTVSYYEGTKNRKLVGSTEGAALAKRLEKLAAKMVAEAEAKREAGMEQAARRQDWLENTQRGRAVQYLERLEQSATAQLRKLEKELRDEFGFGTVSLSCGSATVRYAVAAEHDVDPTLAAAELSLSRMASADVLRVLAVVAKYEPTLHAMNYDAQQVLAACDGEPTFRELEQARRQEGAQ